MALANNPLRQYFRRPSIYLKLPSKGIGYPPGVLNITDTGEFAVYPMTAIDEITSKTPDALFNGSAVTDIIKSCIPDIIDPWQLQSTDLDAVLIAIKSASQGNDLEIQTECPSCKEVSEYGINLVGVLSTLSAPDYSKELQLGEISVKLRPLLYKEMNQAALKQFEMQRLFNSLATIEDETERGIKTTEGIATITKVTMEVLADTIEYINTPTGKVTETPFILDFLQNCDKDTYAQIRDYNTELKTASEMKPLHITCVSCKHEYDQAFTLNAADFFG